MNQRSAGVDIYMIRHAESVMNLSPDIICGRTLDTPLTERGIEQSLELGRQLARVGIMPHLVYVSEAVRPQQTAEYAMQTWGIQRELRVDPRLNEVSQGLWEGRSRTEIYNERQLARIKRDPMNFRAPLGESLAQSQARMASFCMDMVRLAQQQPRERLVVAAFTHGLTTKTLAGMYLDWSAEEIRTGNTPNTSVSSFSYRQGRCTVTVGQSASELVRSV